MVELELVDPHMEYVHSYVTEGGRITDIPFPKDETCCEPFNRKSQCLQFFLTRGMVMCMYDIKSGIPGRR